MSDGRKGRGLQLLDVAERVAQDEGFRRACGLIRGACTGPVTLVGIDGHCGAGKSVLARRLADELGATIVDTKDFYRPMPYERRISLAPEEAAASLQDWRRLRAEVLQPLRKGSDTRYRRYDRRRCVVDRTPVPLHPRGIVILDGVQSTRRELEAFLDVRIFVQTPRELCRERVAAKRAPRVHTLIETWTAAEDWYFEHDDPRSRADLVVPGF